MTPKYLGRRIQHARGLRRTRVISPDDYTVLDHLAYGAGRPLFADRVIESYAEMNEALGFSRSTISRALKKLVAVGLLGVRKRFELVEWHRGKRWAQLANEYQLFPSPHCEFAPATRKQTLDEERKKAAYGISRRLAARAPLRTTAEQIAFCLGGTTEEQRRRAAQRVQR